jgi:hypothetical protein
VLTPRGRVAHDGETMLVLTNKDAPQYKLAALNVSASAAGGGGAPVLRDVVREDPDAVLKDALAVHGGPLLLVYQRAVQDELYEYTRAGERVRRLAEAHVGTISVSGKQNRQTQAFATLAGFTTPGTVVTYDLGVPEKERKVEEWRATVLRGLDPAEFSAEQVWYASADGTRVPMFVVRHKNTPRDGTAPAIQYGYGGFDISVTPAFTPHWLTFCKHFGGLCAVANIRGGGEFGEAWHEGGMRENKVRARLSLARRGSADGRRAQTNCFDEFIAATRFLEEEKIAGKGKVAINGGSNGGLLVAACVNRAPAGTFGAAVAEVGVHDYLKVCPFMCASGTGAERAGSSIGSRSGARGRLTLGTRTSPRTLTLWSRSHPCTTCRAIARSHRRCSSPPTVRALFRRCEGMGELTGGRRRRPGGATALVQARGGAAARAPAERGAIAAARGEEGGARRGQVDRAAVRGPCAGVRGC